jgi:hypothetical protein
MNVTIDSMHSSPASRALWWFTLLFVIVGGLIMRCLTIDRNTPVIGSVIYVVMLAALFIGIACPVGAAVACLVHWTAEWKRAARLHKHAGWWVIALAAVLTLAFFAAGRRIPAWHVWTSAAIFTALVAQRIFHATLSLHAQTRQENSNEFFDASDPHALRADKTRRVCDPIASYASLASDDRRVMICWRQYCSTVNSKHIR